MYIRRDNNYVIRYETLWSPSNVVLNKQTVSIKSSYYKLIGKHSSSLCSDNESTLEFIKVITTNVFKYSQYLEHQFNINELGVEYSTPLILRNLMVNVVKNVIGHISLDMRIRGLVFSSVNIDYMVISIECY